MKKATDKQYWNEFVLEHGPRSGTFLQSWEWGDVQIANGQGVIRYETDDARAQVTSLRLPMGQRYKYIARGPIASCSVASSDMLKLIVDEDNNDMFVRVDAAHEVSVANSRIIKDVQPSTTLITSLVQGEADIMKAMHSKTRYNIRLAQKKEVDVQIGVDALDVFVSLVKETGNRHGIRSHGREHYEAILNKLDGTNNGPRAFIALAVHDSDVLAAAMCVDWHDTRTYLHGASSDNKKNFMAPYLLHWKLMDDAKTHGLSEYDWWGIAPEGSVDHPLAGVTRFKKGFGGEVVASPVTIDIIRKPVWYRFYSVARKVL